MTTTTINRKCGIGGESKAAHRSKQNQTDICVQPMCGCHSEVICRHCSQHFCYLCIMSHRKYILYDMSSIQEQMTKNRKQGVDEVVAFIEKQAKNAHQEAKQLVDDAIERILKASKNIYSYIENRRQAKMGRLTECLEKYDKDAQLLESKLKRNVFLEAAEIHELRKKYAYNMFDSAVVGHNSDAGLLSSNQLTKRTAQQKENEKFFANYCYYDELINLRQKWTFLQAALTTVYYPAKKDISLDKILTFLEYRHDRVIENYREHLSTKEDAATLALSLKPSEELLNDLSFLNKKGVAKEFYNFCYINEHPIDEDPISEDLEDQNSSDSWRKSSSLQPQQQLNHVPTCISAIDDNTISSKKDIVKEPTTATECETTSTAQQQQQQQQQHELGGRKAVDPSSTSDEEEQQQLQQCRNDQYGFDSSNTGSWEEVEGFNGRYDNHPYEQLNDLEESVKLEKCDQKFQKLVETLKKVEQQFEQDYQILSNQ